MRFDIITIFPEMFASVFSGGVVKRALERETVRIAVHDLRDFTEDKHRQVDDRPYGGLEGMVLKPEPIFRAVEAVREDAASRVYLLSPQGRPLDTALARELAAAVVVDAAARFVPGVVGKEGSVRNDSFAGGLLDYPQYTRPPVFREMAVPEILLSGNHAQIERWRQRESLRRTLARRPDLLDRAPLSEEDRDFLEELKGQEK